MRRCSIWSISSSLMKYKWCLGISEIIADCLSVEAGSTPAGIAKGFKVVVYSLKTIPNATERATVGKSTAKSVGFGNRSMVNVGVVLVE